eukprot:1146440-Pelagomonas_calceolata.AAC.3
MIVRIWRVTGSTRLQNLAICMPLCHLQFLPRPSIFTMFSLFQVYVPLVHTQLMGLSNAGNCVGPVWVLCLLHNTWCEEEEEKEEEEEGEGVGLAF